MSRKKLAKFDGGLDELCGFEGDAERGADEIAGERIGESHAPEMRGGLAPAASGGEAADASDGVAESEAGGEGVPSGERRHVAAAQIPYCSKPGAN